MKRAYTITETSKLLKVSRITIYRWIKDGKIKFNILPNNKKRIPATEVEKFII